jgi:hypothetical protein
MGYFDASLGKNVRKGSAGPLAKLKGKANAVATLKQGKSSGKSSGRAAGSGKKK